jgi:hypothetical protein
MTRTILIILAASSLAAAQSPTKTQYETDLFNSMATIQANISLGPPSHIALTAQHLAGNSHWINAGKGFCNPAAAYGSASACIWNNITALNSYTDALHRAGATGIDLHVDPLALSASSQYNPPAQYRFASDCPNGWECRTLANYDALIAHAVSLGLTIKLRPTPETVVAAAGLTASNTLADLENWMLPLYVAAAKRWGTSITSFTVLHEAIGGFSSSVPFHVTVPSVDTFVSDTATAVRAAQSTIKVGAAAETMFGGDAPYFQSYLNLGLDYVGVDLYGSACDVKLYPSTAFATASSWATAARKARMPIAVEESARPRWLPYTCTTPDEPYAYEGAGDIDWVLDGADAAWLQAVVPALAALGYSSFSVYPAPPFIWATSDHVNDNMQIGTYTKNVMSYLSGETSTGTTYGVLSTSY